MATDAVAERDGGRLELRQCEPGIPDLAEPGHAEPHVVQARLGTGTGLTPTASAPGPGSPLPHLHRDWAQPCHICTSTRLANLLLDWAHRCRFCAQAGLTPPRSAPGLGLAPSHICARTGPTRKRHVQPALKREVRVRLGEELARVPADGRVPHLHRDWARRCPIRTRDWAPPATSAPGLCSPHPFRTVTQTGFVVAQCMLLQLSAP
jgi:hypothetical protein